MNEIKVWASRIFNSRTMLATFALDIIGVIQLNTDFISTVLTPKQFGWLILSCGLLFKILRLITTQPITDK